MIKQLKETMQIDRAQMRLKLVLPSKDAKKVQEKLRPHITAVESEEWQAGLEMVENLYVYYFSFMQFIRSLEPQPEFLGLPFCRCVL